MGSAASSPVDDSGRFALQNVPAGHVDLHFTGPGVDAHLLLDGVADHATITIAVRVSGSTAQLDNDDRQGPNNEAEVEGLVTATSANTITVNGKMITVTATTEIVHGDTMVAFSSIRVGDRVHVKGTSGTAGNTPTIVATKIEVQNTAGNPNGGGDDQGGNDPGDDHGGNAEADLKGAIAGLGGSCAAHTLSFSIGATKVTTNASTQFKDVACTSLKSGDSVEVKGARQPDASVLASRVEKNK